MKSHRIARLLQSNQKLVLLALLSLAAITFLSFRMALTKSAAYYFLTWNLFLAWVPLVHARWLWERQSRRPFLQTSLVTHLAVWLLFFPNAPYLITDLIHIRHSYDNTIWYDALMVFYFAACGLLAGLYSLRTIHRVVASRWNETAAWPLIFTASVLSSFGIYLGRYGRWNSWDIVGRPLQLTKGIIASLTSPLAMKVTLSFSFFLLITYFVFYLYSELTRPVTHAIRN